MASHSDGDESISVLRKKRDSTGVIPNSKQKGKNTPKHHGAQRYYVLCKKSGMPEKNIMLYRYVKVFG